MKKVFSKKNVYFHKQAFYGKAKSFDKSSHLNTVFKLLKIRYAFNSN